MSETNEILEAAVETTVLRSANVAGAEVPSCVMLAPWGTVRSANGHFVVDTEGAGLAVGAFSEHGTDLPIDYEHQSLGGSYASPDGQAPAAGWIKELEARASHGLFAHIEWTDRAAEQLGAKAYRYLSPVAIVRKSDRRLVGIHSAALTNKPAIANMQPIVNRVAGPDAELSVSPLSWLRKELDLDTDASAEVVLAAAGQRLAELDEIHRRARVRARVAEALDAGKLVEAQREWAEDLAARDEASFEAYLRAAPSIVARGRLAPPSSATRASREARRARAEAEYRVHPMLQALTSERAYVDDALRGTAHAESTR